MSKIIHFDSEKKRTAGCVSPVTMSRMAVRRGRVYSKGSRMAVRRL